LSKRAALGGGAHAHSRTLTHTHTHAPTHTHLHTHQPKPTPQIRKRNKIHSESKLKIKIAEGDIYIATIDDRVAVKLGPRMDMGYHKPRKEDGWTRVASGRDFAVWERPPPPPPPKS
jgi:alpha-amylase